MAEKESLGKKTLEYDGILSVKELFEVIKDTASDKGFKAVEGEHVESIKKEGKHIKIKFLLNKTLSDYVKLQTIAKLQFSELKDTKLEKEGKKKKFQAGKLYIELEPVLISDYEKKWEGKPWMILTRWLFEKFLYKTELGEFKKQGVDLMEKLYDNIGTYLNLQKY